MFKLLVMLEMTNFVVLCYLIQPSMRMFEFMTINFIYIEVLPMVTIVSRKNLLQDMFFKFGWVMFEA
jgi:hypothetical protein